VVIDYGGGNLGSLVAALQRQNANFVVSGEPSAVRDAAAAILPGDGAFAATFSALRERGLDASIAAFLESGRPFLGICVGMQLLYERSTEFGGASGLGFFEGEISRFDRAPRVPHIGWNHLEPLQPHPFLEGVGDEAYAYFLHSYRAPVSASTIAAVTHGERFSAIVARKNVFGTQFHPEKSRETGRRLLVNFLHIAEE
jgi:glutamine amidotransferase